MLLASPPVSSARAEMGWAIGRPVGTAVARNLLRRRLRALFAGEHRSTPLPPGAYVVRADTGAAVLTHAELASHVHELAAAARRTVPE